MILYPRFLEPNNKSAFRQRKTAYNILVYHIILRGIDQYNIRVATRFPRLLNAHRGLVLLREISHGPQFTSV